MQQGVPVTSRCWAMLWCLVGLDGRSDAPAGPTGTLGLPVRRRPMRPSAVVPRRFRRVGRLPCLTPPVAMGRGARTGRWTAARATAQAGARRYARGWSQKYRVRAAFPIAPHVLRPAQGSARVRAGYVPPSDRVTAPGRGAPAAAEVREYAPAP